MNPATFVLALALAVPTVLARADAGQARLLHRVDAIPMSWRVEKEAGSEAGPRRCLVASRGGDVSARLARDPRTRAPAWSVRVGSDNQPGSLRYLRVNERFFQTDEPDFRGAEAEAIVELLKTPGEFAFEWAQRPDYAKRMGLYGTGDFAAKAAECERWIAGTRVRGPSPPARTAAPGIVDHAASG